MDKKEMAEVFERFLNETGNYYRFKEFVEEQGYYMAEFLMLEED